MKPSARFRRRYVSFALSADGKPPSAQEAKGMVHEHFRFGACIEDRLEDYGPWLLLLWLPLVLMIVGARMVRR